MPRVLIFGVGGFVGKYLADEFASHDYSVIGCDRNAIQNVESIASFFQCDLEDGQEVVRVIREVRPDIIVNLAAISSVALSWRNPALTFQVNVIGTVNILEAVRQFDTRIKTLLIGSSEEYAPSDSPLSEASPIIANNPYGVSKIAQENLADMYAQSYGLRIYRTRSFNHIGVGQSASFVIPSWIKQVADLDRARSDGVLYVGNTEVRRDFTDVRDVVRAYRLLVESEYDNEVFNIGAGKSYLLKDILDLIVSFSSRTIQVEADPELFRPVDNQVVCSDCSKAHRLLGWVPQYTIEDSLKNIYYSML